jgi:ribosome maturation factor RimP
LEKSLGETVELRTYKPIDKRKEFSGILKAFDKDTITIEDETGERVFARADTALIRLAIDF